MGLEGLALERVRSRSTANIIAGFFGRSGGVCDAAFPPRVEPDSIAVTRVSGLPPTGGAPKWGRG